MSKILITGATGNVGGAILNHLDFEEDEIFAGVRNIERAQKSLNEYRCSLIEFDFETGKGFDSVGEFDILFLLRPPHIGDVKRYLFPLLEKAKKGNTAVVFLSVQGADKKSFIPHAKVEAEIWRLGIPHIFLRPSYFLDNLTTTLGKELQINKRIYMPSGDLKFNWISVDSIGKAGAKVLQNFTSYTGRVFELTSSKNVGFREIIDSLNLVCDTSFKYESANLFSFIRYRRQLGESWGYIGVMLLLHFLPKFEAEPNISDDYHRLMDEDAETIEEFISRNSLWFKQL